LASSDWAVKGYVREFANRMQKEYACGDVHENRAEYLGFFQFLRNFRHQNAFEQVELIL